MHSLHKQRLDGALDMTWSELTFWTEALEIVMRHPGILAAGPDVKGNMLQASQDFVQERYLKMWEAGGSKGPGQQGPPPGSPSIRGLDPVWPERSSPF